MSGSLVTPLYYQPSEQDWNNWMQQLTLWSQNVNSLTTGLPVTSQSIQDIFQNTQSTANAQILYIVPTLPTSGDFNGQTVFDEATGYLYTWNANATPPAWTQAAGATSFAQLTGQIESSQIPNNIITGSMIEAATITGNNIATGTVTGANISAATIEGNNIQNLAITAAQIANLTITNNQIANGTLGSAQVATGGLVGSNLANGTITGTQIGNATITGSNIANATITGSNIASGAISGSQIQSATITATNIENLTITASQIANETINTGQIAANAVTNYGITEAPTLDTYTWPTSTSGSVNEALVSVNYTASGTSGSWIEVTGFAVVEDVIAPNAGSSYGSADLNVVLARDGTQVGSGSYTFIAGDSAASTQLCYLSAVDTSATAGAHTYSISAMGTIEPPEGGATSGCQISWANAVIKAREMKR